MRSADTPLYVRLLSRLVEPFPDFDFGFIKPVRRRAVALLQLSAEAHVLDVGCGSGGSFPYLVQAVGPGGRVVGVELSARSAAHAARRAARHDWRNVDVLVSAAEAVSLSGAYDGLLMFAAPDVYASRASLDRLLPHLAEGARIVFFGGKKSTRRFGWLLNGLLNFALTKLSLPSTPGLDTAPWDLIAGRTSDLVVQEYFHGWMFLASCSVRRDAPSAMPPVRTPCS
jgi:SAM-dependent methyltransferase